MPFDLGQHIRQTRMTLDWSQTDLAARAGIDQGDLSRIERGDTDPRWSTVERISAALGEAIVVEQPSTTARPLSADSRQEVRARGRRRRLDLSGLPEGPVYVKR